MTANNRIVIVIPSYEPDNNLIDLLENLKYASMFPVVLINDGSGPEYNQYFEQASTNYGCTVLTHAVNLGKGRSLKDAFNYLLVHEQDIEGVITADSDGQHSVECIEKVKMELIANPDALILGTRNFDGNDIPWRSKFGNKLTKNIFKFLYGIDISDTQTGLRGIPKDFMKKLLSVQGERFEFETRMLIVAKGFCAIREVPIKTIYDSKKNHSTHFDPIKDSWKIYKIFCGIFLKYIISSLSSFAVDLMLFTIFSNMLIGWNKIYYVFVATVLARIISATYNYLINYKFVFSSNKNKKTSAIKYFCLAIIQMALSALLVTIGVYFIKLIPEVVIKRYFSTNSC